MPAALNGASCAYAGVASTQTSAALRNSLIEVSPSVHNHDDIVVRPEAAVVCEASEHIFSRLTERHLRRPLPILRHRRGLPSRGPRRVAAVPRILPDFGLRRIEGHRRLTAIEEPR